MEIYKNGAKKLDPNQGGDSGTQFVVKSGAPEVRKDVVLSYIFA